MFCETKYSQTVSLNVIQPINEFRDKLFCYSREKAMRGIIHRLIFLTVFCLSGTILAAPTGKIAGVITDAETGEPLPGVNVIVVDTDLGAATDQQGRYSILNVPPGEYTLRAMMIGYADYIVSNVQVEIDLTTTINMQMQTEALTGEAVQVVAQRPVVQKDVSQSRLNVSSEEITSMPVENIERVVGLQAGIQGMRVRGGDESETQFMIDGLALSDARTNQPFTGISLSAVKEIKIETGGFNAEYGNLRSGLVNVVTKEGAKSAYNGEFTYRYSPPAAKNFGPSVYDLYSYFTRPYMDPAVMWTGTDNGNWDFHTRQQYPTFTEGWIGVAEKTLADKDTTNDMTPSAAKRLYEWRHRRAGDITQPDYNVDFGFGGPVPFFSDPLGDLRFFLSHRQEQSMLLFPLSRSAYRDNMTQLKLTSDITDAVKFMGTALYGKVKSVSNTNSVPTGGYVSYATQPAYMVGGASPASVLFEPGYFNPSNIYRNMVGFEVSHMIDDNTFYEVSFQRTANIYRTDTTAHRDLTRDNWIVPPEVVNGDTIPGTGFAADEAPFGYYGYPSESIGDQMWTGAWMGLAHDQSENVTYTLEGDFTSQLNAQNHFKTGFKFEYNNYDINAFTYNPNWSTWTRELIYQRFPYRFGAYAQDKLEVSEFIMNAGVRLDYSNPNGKWYQLNQYDELLQEQKGDQLDSLATMKPLDAQLVWSPRLGVSHPITVNSKLYFNYGHFRQLPQPRYRFQIHREANGQITQIGNPSLDMPKTIAYELGYEQGLFDQYLLKVAAFYKDITEQPTYTNYQNISGTVDYARAVSDSYEDIRGFELTLKKRMGYWIRGFVNYTYTVNTSGYFGIRQYYQDPIEQQRYLEENPYQEKPAPQPYARANLNFFTPDEYGPRLMGFLPLAGWKANVIASWSAGSFATYNPQNQPGVRDNVQWKDRYNIDLRFSRTFDLDKVGLEFFVDVSNLLNTKYMSSAGFSDSRDYLNYMESLHFDWEEGVEHGNDRIGKYRDWETEFRPLDEVTEVTNVPQPHERTVYYETNNERYMQYMGGEWQEMSNAEVQEIMDSNAYIDMPNIRSLTFLNPRDITFGIRIRF